MSYNVDLFGQIQRASEAAAAATEAAQAALDVERVSVAASTARAYAEVCATISTQSRRIYERGKVGYIDALDAERVLATSEAALAVGEAQIADDQVVLFVALSGGWDVDTGNGHSWRGPFHMYYQSSTSERPTAVKRVMS